MDDVELLESSSCPDHAEVEQPEPRQAKQSPQLPFDQPAPGPEPSHACSVECRRRSARMNVDGCDTVLRGLVAGTRVEYGHLDATLASRSCGSQGTRICPEAGRRQQKDAANGQGALGDHLSTIGLGTCGTRIFIARDVTTTTDIRGSRAATPRPPGARHSATLLFSHRKLLLRVTRNELAARYAGSVLGLGWALLSPALFLGIYAVVYLFVFRASPTGLTTSQYALYIITGLVPYIVTAEALSFGVTSVVANKSVLSNVVFPIDLVPPKAVMLAQQTMVVGTFAVLVGSVVCGTLSWYVLLAPVVWVLQTMALIGAVWFLSLLNVLVRDLTHAIAILLLIMLIASPIAYTPAMVPDRLKFILALNPFAYFVVAYQQLIVLGQLPTMYQRIGLIVIPVVLFGLGGWFFARAKRVLIDYV
jgi:lipopolysaccharide transport system permease protein